MISRPAIDHALHRAATTGPDAENVYVDDAGTAWLRFAVDFECDGQTFTTHIWAQDAADAEWRLLSLCATGRVAGQVYAERDAT